MAKMRDLTGQTFGKLTAIKPIGKSHAKFVWEFQCQCGNLYEAIGTSVTGGDVVSCGCHRARQGGETNTPTYHTWYNMLKRCNDPDNKDYPDYGGRGITVCPEWYDWKTFLKDMGHKPVGYTIERRDNLKGYSPDNCSWETYEVQENNRRDNRLITFNGKTQTLSKWAKSLGLRVDTLHLRLKRGIPVEEALSRGRLNGRT
jgi:hypothetical protein